MCRTRVAGSRIPVLGNRSERSWRGGRRNHSRSADQDTVEHDTLNAVDRSDVERQPRARVLAFEMRVFTAEREPAPHFDFSPQRVRKLRHDGTAGCGAGRDPQRSIENDHEIGAWRHDRSRPGAEPQSAGVKKCGNEGDGGNDPTDAEPKRGGQAREDGDDSGREQDGREGLLHFQPAIIRDFQAGGWKMEAGSSNAKPGTTSSIHTESFAQPGTEYPWRLRNEGNR